jgi:peptidoglycan hydrolase-like protein with peptidoglycan-binding domain
VVYSSDYPVISGSVAAEAQAELRRRGYYDGAVDGVIGPRTRNAIAAFQDDAGLATTGRLNNSTLSALGIS